MPTLGTLQMPGLPQDEAQPLNAVGHQRLPTPQSPIQGTPKGRASPRFGLPLRTWGTPPGRRRRSRGSCPEGEARPRGHRFQHRGSWSQAREKATCRAQAGHPETATLKGGSSFPFNEGLQLQKQKCFDMLRPLSDVPLPNISWTIAVLTGPVVKTTKCRSGL